MNTYTIDPFIQATAQRDEVRNRFELENAHLLEVNLDGRVWAQMEAMIGYIDSMQAAS